MVQFSERYGAFRQRRACVAEESFETPKEAIVQAIWFDQLLCTDALETVDGRSLEIVSPGWWNHGEGPDFKGAQIQFGDELVSGDVEVHLTSAGWRSHGHHLDDRYDDVILHVLLDGDSNTPNAGTSGGHRIPTLVLRDYLEKESLSIAEDSYDVDFPFEASATHGACAGLLEIQDTSRLIKLLELAGDWRMVFKARSLRHRISQVGVDQAAYEALMYAIGFSHFKFHFRVLAEQLHYDRARQLCKQDPFLFEAALMQMAGLIPATLPEGAAGLPHFSRLRQRSRDRLPGLRALPLEWKRVAVRPVNYPERRIAGASMFVARTAKDGIVTTLESIWAEDLKPTARRKAFEALFPKARGFWATHCTWDGKKLGTETALIGPGRVRSIIGNVIVPLALGLARQYRDRQREERVLKFFAALPKEPGNHIQKRMLPRLFGDQEPPRLNFRLQQGLLQMYHDWCEPNPSCRNCPVIPHLAGKD